MNKVTFPERKRPPVKGASYGIGKVLTGHRVNLEVFSNFLTSLSSLSRFPQSGITTAVRNLCSSGARCKKAMLLDLVKDRPPVRQPLNGAGNGDLKGHLVSPGYR